MNINAKHLAILCACHFIAHFAFKDLPGKKYHSDYECEFGDVECELWCKAQFDDSQKSVIEFEFGIEASEYEEIEITGSLTSGREAALKIINDYLESYSFI